MEVFINGYHLLTLVIIILDIFEYTDDFGYESLLQMYLTYDQFIHLLHL
jgi:hypothetical protein